MLAGSVGTLAAPFTVQSGGEPFVLAPGQQMAVQIGFAPTMRGRARDTLVVDSLTHGQPAVAVRIVGDGWE